jgi:hypothetical protein
LEGATAALGANQDEIEVEFEMRYHAAVGRDVDGLVDPRDVE